MPKNVYHHVVHTAQQMNRIQSQAEGRQMKPKKKMGRLRRILLVALLILIVLLFLFWSKLHIIWLIH